MCDFVVVKFQSLL